MSHSNPCLDDGGAGYGRSVTPSVPFAWMAEVLAEPAHAIFGTAQLAHRGVARLVSRMEDARRYRQTVRELSRLDAHVLEDIGVRRGDIPRIARDLVAQGARR